MRKQLPVLRVLWVSSAALLLGACTHSGKSSSASGPANGTAPIVAQPDLASLQVGVGARDFNQLNQTMASLTGVDPTNSTAVNTFNAVSASLPNSNDVKSIAAPNIVAITRLASQYCDLLVGSSSNPLRATLFPGITFSGSSTSVTATQRDAVINALLSRFTKDSPPSPDDVSTLQQLTTDLQTAGASTVGLMVSLCTAALGSVKATVTL